MKSSIFRYFGVLAIAIALPASTQNVSGAEKVQVIRVQVNFRNFDVFPKKVTAGPALVLIENQTFIDAPTVTVKGKNAQASQALKVDKPKKVKAKESWQDIVLTPGTYKVVLDQIPGLQTELTVEP